MSRSAVTTAKKDSVVDDIRANNHGDVTDFILSNNGRMSALSNSN